MVGACLSVEETTNTKLSQQLTKSHNTKQWAGGGGAKKRNLWWYFLSGAFFMCFWSWKGSKKEKKKKCTMRKTSEFSHIKKRGVVAERNAGSQYSSCSSCWSSGPSSCWFSSLSSPSANSPRSFKNKEQNYSESKFKDMWSRTKAQFFPSSIWMFFWSVWGNSLTCSSEA